MRHSVFLIALLVVTLPLHGTAQSAGPSNIASSTAIAPPTDRPYPGEIHLRVDASDISHRIYRVHETLTGIGADTVLLFPKWLPGTHAPEGPIDKLAAIKITAAGVPVPWTRDPVDVYAFRVAGAASSIDIDFEYLSPTKPDVGDVEISPNLLMLDWNQLVLYPAGYFTRQIPVHASLKLPPQWQYGTALEDLSGDRQPTFKVVSLETLIDSPVYAGQYSQRLDLDPGSAVPVHLDLFADRPSLLTVKPEQLEVHRALVRQAYKLFASHHYAHYDFLYSLSDQIHQMGLEHHQSSENGADPDLFTEWDKTAFERDLLAHEYTHSWNGKFRRPADLWTPNYNVPMQNSLLWVYEGQTQYWGDVLAARAGLRTPQQSLDDVAMNAAYYQNQSGRQWRSLQDTTNDEIINPRRPISWRTWQRYEDYYTEGELIWLDVDTLIRERSHDKRSLDDFARAFFGIEDGRVNPVTYTFDDVVKALNAVERYDWSSFLRQRLDSVGSPAPLDGVKRGGYTLVYTDAPGDYQKSIDLQRKHVSLLYSIGIDIDDSADKGTISQVQHNSAAFKANLTSGTQILAINGIAYSADVLKDAIRAARSTSTSIELIVKTDDHFTVTKLDYHDGLRYPHLQRDPSVPARLDAIFKARS